MRVFGGVQASGNLCAVIAQIPPSHVPAAELTRCYSWPDEGGAFVVACYTAAGEQIHCCGHGLLAVAHYWLKDGEGERVTLRMGDARLHAHREGEHCWVGFGHLAIANAPVPDWVARVFPVAPTRAAVAGGPAGYVLLEWPEDFHLPLLPVPDAGLGQFTDCALIAFSRCSTGEYPIHLRYFAPQYGVDEDSATGSALRVLADYCWQVYGMAEFTARQCSPGGGVLRAQVDSQQVAIGGEVITC
jgi:predicted PhzF superfamily epimerase YddE/YHI9